MLFEFWKGRRFRKKISVGTLVFSRSRRRRKWHGTHCYKPEGQWNTAADVMVGQFLEDSGHRVFRASSALDRGFLKEKVGKCTIRSSGDMSNAKLLFHTHYAKSVQYLRSSIELVWRIDSADTWPIICRHGEIRCEGEWTVMFENWSLRKCIRWDECSNSDGSTLYPSRKICKMVKWDKGISDLWIWWLHEESLYWTTLPNHPRCERRIWRKDRVMQRVFVASWSRFWTYWMDQWAHQDRSSSSGQNYMLSWSRWNWDTGTVNVKRRI